MNGRNNDLILTKGSVVIILISLNLYPLYLSLIAWSRVGKFQRIFTDMFEGEPLPVITNILLATYKFFGIIPIILILLSFGLFFIRKYAGVYATLIGVITLISALSMRILILEGLVQPFILIMKKLS